MQGVSKTILLYERYLVNSQDEIDFYDQLGLPLPKKYDYVARDFLVDDIVEVRQVSEIDSVIRFYDGVKSRVYGDADDLFIRINDLKNNPGYDEGI